MPRFLSFNLPARVRLAGKQALLLCLLALTLCRAHAGEGPKVRPANWAQPVIGTSLNNFYRISDELYRSEQPSKSDGADLKHLGIRTVISLRKYHSDPKDFEQFKIQTVRYPLEADSLSTSNLITALRLIRSAQKPVLLHCWHGSDRTGFVAAGYRMVFMNWTAADAIEELRLGGFGYHESFYPEIIKALQEMDVPAVKKAVLE